MSSCRHFLSNRKQGLVSKRAKEGSAVAKPRPMHLVSGNLLGAKKTPSQDSIASKSPGESSVGSELCFTSRQETDAKQQPRPNSTFLRAATRWHSIFQHQETGAEWWICKLREHQEAAARYRLQAWKDKIGMPQYANLRLSTRWESLQELSTEVHCLRRRTRTWLEDECIEAGDYLCRQRWKPLFILDQITMQNLEVYRSTNFEQLKKLFDITHRLILEHEAEILNVIYDWLERFLMHEIYA